MSTTETSLSKPTEPTEPKKTNYSTYRSEKSIDHLMTLFKDNLEQLIEYMYSNKDRKPYDSAEVRVSIALQILFAGDKLIPFQLSGRVARDIESLMNDFKYLSQWENPTKRKKTLKSELLFLRQHTEIDDLVSLNLSDGGDLDQKIELFKDFDLESSVSTLNVSVQRPVPGNDGTCAVM